MIGQAIKEYYKHTINGLISTFIGGIQYFFVLRYDVVYYVCDVV